MTCRPALLLVPVDRATVCAFIDEHHRHHEPPVQWKFAVGVESDGRLVAVGVAARPVARALDDGRTIEIVRCCTDGTRNAASMIYGALSRAAFALGYKKVITYTLASETGRSLIAAGFEAEVTTKGGSWSCKSRPRVDRHPIEPKTRWGKA